MKKNVLLLMITIMLVFVSACGTPSKKISEGKEFSSENSEQKTKEDIKEKLESDNQKENAEDKKEPEIEEDIKKESELDNQKENVENKKKPEIEEDEESDKVEKVPSDNSLCSHDYEKATCVKPKTCKKCGLIIGNVTGHTWSDWSTEVAPSTEKNGLEKRHCTVCEQIEERKIEPLSQPEVDTKKTWFISQYNVAKQQYIREIEKLISEKQEKVEEIKEEAKIAKDKYDAEMLRLNKLPTSGTKDVWIKGTQQKYYNESLDRTNKSNTIKSEIAELEAKIVTPDVDNILTIMSRNSNISSIEIYEYYSKYSDCIN